MSSSVEYINEIVNGTIQEEYVKHTRLDENVKLQVCKYCGKLFVTPKRRGRPSEYCSDTCRSYAREEQSRLKSFRWYHRHKHELSEKQRWGLGSGFLSGSRNSDFERESEIIRRELGRLKLR